MIALCAKEAGVEEDFLTVAARRAFWNWKNSDLLKVAVMRGVPLLDKNNIFQIVLDLAKWGVESIGQTSNFCNIVSEIRLLRHGQV